MKNVNFEMTKTKNEKNEKNGENGNVPLNVIWNWILPLEMSLCLEPFSTATLRVPLSDQF